MIVAERSDSATRTEAQHLEGYLYDWARWMRSKDDLPQGCPTEASGGLQSYTGFDIDEMIDHMDADNAETTHLAIWRLPELERNAIYFEREIIRDVAIWRYEVVLANAKARLLVELKKLGLWFGS